MQTTPITPATLAASVIAVPPLARDANFIVQREENTRIIRHIEAGGVTTLLYGGNANFYHLRPSEYEAILVMLAELAAEDSLMIPSVGPAYGLQMDQAAIFKQTTFPSAMILPQEGLMTETGLMTGFRHFVEAVERPAVLYIKREGYITPEGAARLVNDGLVSFIKYAIVRDDPAVDPFLAALIQLVDPQIIVSGIGEQPALVHLENFKINGFTAGCVCVRPDLSQEMLRELKAGNLDRVREIQAIFEPLENLRNGINPVRVLHEAVTAAGIADTGPQLPLLHDLSASERESVARAAKALIAV